MNEKKLWRLTCVMVDGFKASYGITCQCFPYNDVDRYMNNGVWNWQIEKSSGEEPIFVSYPPRSILKIEVEEVKETE